MNYYVLLLNFPLQDSDVIFVYICVVIHFIKPQIDNLYFVLLKSISVDFNGTKLRVVTVGIRALGSTEFLSLWGKSSLEIG